MEQNHHNYFFADESPCISCEAISIHPFNHLLCGSNSDFCTITRTAWDATEIDDNYKTKHEHFSSFRNAQLASLYLVVLRFAVILCTRWWLLHPMLPSMASISQTVKRWIGGKTDTLSGPWHGGIQAWRRDRRASSLRRQRAQQQIGTQLIKLNNSWSGWWWILIELVNFVRVVKAKEQTEARKMHCLMMEVIEGGKKNYTKPRCEFSRGLISSSCRSLSAWVKA